MQIPASDLLSVNGIPVDYEIRSRGPVTHTPILSLFSARPKSRRDARLAHAVNFTIATRQANFITQVAPTDDDQERRRDLPVREHSLLRRRLERDLTSGLEKSQVGFDESRPYCAFSASDSAIESLLSLIKTHRRSWDALVGSAIRGNGQRHTNILYRATSACEERMYIQLVSQRLAPKLDGRPFKLRQL